jgi:hypothetical protein
MFGSVPRNSPNPKGPSTVQDLFGKPVNHGTAVIKPPPRVPYTAPTGFAVKPQELTGIKGTKGINGATLPESSADSDIDFHVKMPPRKEYPATIIIHPEAKPKPGDEPPPYTDADFS